MTHQDQWTEDLAHSGASASIPGEPEAAAGAGSVEVWKGNKRQREALRQRFGGRCAYCGDVLTAMHCDHLEPVIRYRVEGDPWGRTPATTQMVKPERNVVTNMMPACKGCNLHKGGYSLEGWRDILQRAPEIVGKQTSTFRAALRLGVISVSAHPVTFYFERLEQAALADREQPGTDGREATGSEQKSPPRSVSLSGEAVAWQTTDLTTGKVDVTNDASFAKIRREARYFGSPMWTVQPLYTAPSSQGGEGGA